MKKKKGTKTKKVKDKFKRIDRDKQDKVNNTDSVFIFLII